MRRRRSWLKRCRDFSADRGLDSGGQGEVMGRLRHSDRRELWQDEKKEPGYNPTQVITRPLYPDRADTIVQCVGCSKPAPRGLPAAEAIPAAGRESCYRAASQAGAFGRIVRIPLATRDRRIFTPTPYGSPSWKRGYRRRPALERIYSRLDNDFGFERHSSGNSSWPCARDAGIGCAADGSPIGSGSSPQRPSRRFQEPKGFLNGIGSRKPFFSDLPHIEWSLHSREGSRSDPTGSQATGSKQATGFRGSPARRR